MTRLVMALLLAGGLDAGVRSAAGSAGGRPGQGLPGEARAADRRPSAPRAPDAGVEHDVRLTAEECDGLVDLLILISVNDSLQHSAEYQALGAEERAATKKEVQRRALADSRLALLKRDCPVRYTRRQADCIHQAKSMDEADACPR